MYRYSVKTVERVVDGDTVDVVIDLGFSIWIKQRIRLAGLDAPEMNSTNEEERRLALEAKAFVTDWLGHNQTLVVETSKDDKYGRMLGSFFALGGTRSLNEEMVDEGYAWAYDGGKKNKDTSILLEKRER